MAVEDIALESGLAAAVLEVRLDGLVVVVAAGGPHRGGGAPVVGAGHVEALVLRGDGVVQLDRRSAQPAGIVGVEREHEHRRVDDGVADIEVRAGRAHDHLGGGGVLVEVVLRVAGAGALVDERDLTGVQDGVGHEGDAAGVGVAHHDALAGVHDGAVDVGGGGVLVGLDVAVVGVHDAVGVDVDVRADGVGRVAGAAVVHIGDIQRGADEGVLAREVVQAVVVRLGQGDHVGLGRDGVQRGEVLVGQARRGDGELVQLHDLAGGVRVALALDVGGVQLLEILGERVLGAVHGQVGPAEGVDGRIIIVVVVIIAELAGAHDAVQTQHPDGAVLALGVAGRGERGVRHVDGRERVVRAEAAEQGRAGDAVADDVDVVDVKHAVAGDRDGAAVAGEVVAAGLVVAGLQDVEARFGDAVLAVHDRDDADVGLVGGDGRAGDAVGGDLTVHGGFGHDQLVAVLRDEGLGVIRPGGVRARGEGHDLEDDAALIRAGLLRRRDAVHGHDDAVAVGGNVLVVDREGQPVGEGGGLGDHGAGRAGRLAGRQRGHAERRQHGEHDDHAEKFPCCFHGFPPCPGAAEKAGAAGLNLRHCHITHFNIPRADCQVPHTHGNTCAVSIN